MSDSFVKFENCYKSFGKLEVLKDYSLNIKKGESTVIIGGSGSGKSVSIKCLLGLITPDHGKIYVDGFEVTSASESKKYEINRRIGTLFQNSALFDSMNVLENIAFGLIQGQSADKKKSYERAYECIQQVGLSSNVATKMPSDLSGGMQKRVALARAIAYKPEIILFDEPTTGLDPISAVTIDNLIISCVKDIGATAISITHDINSLRRIADKVAFLYLGKIVWEGTVKEMDKTNNPFIKQFISGSENGPIEWAKTK